MKSRGEMFYEVLHRQCVGGFDRIWSARGKAFQKTMETAAAEYDKAVAELSADVEAQTNVAKDDS